MLMNLALNGPSKLSRYIIHDLLDWDPRTVVQVVAVWNEHGTVLVRAHDLSFSPEVFGFLRLNVWNMKQSYAIFCVCVCLYRSVFGTIGFISRVTLNMFVSQVPFCWMSHSMASSLSTSHPLGDQKGIMWIPVICCQNMGDLSFA